MNKDQLNWQLAAKNVLFCVVLLATTVMTGCQSVPSSGSEVAGAPGYECAPGVLGFEEGCQSIT